MNYSNSIKSIEEFGKVYAIIPSNIMGMFTISILYVGNETYTWEDELASLKQGIAYARVINCDIPKFSDFGCIGIKKIDGYLFRIY